MKKRMLGLACGIVFLSGGAWPGDSRTVHLIPMSQVTTTTTSTYRGRDIANNPSRFHATPTRHRSPNFPSWSIEEGQPCMGTAFWL